MASLEDKKDGVRVTGPKLRIELLGPFRIRFGDTLVDVQSRKAKAILGSLAMADDWKQPRERFYGLLWSETDTERARASLRTEIYGIRSILDAALPQAFMADRHSIWFDPAQVEVDLWEALEGAKTGVATAPLFERERVTENILADCELLDAAFRDWLIAKRQSLHTRLLEALEDSLRRFPIGDPDPRIEPLARAIARLDPTHEEAVRAIIRARAAAGDLGGALRVYRVLWDLLETEFDIRPSKETQDVIAQLRLAQPEGGERDASSLSPVAPTAPLPGLVGQPLPGQGPPPLVPPVARKLLINIGGFDASGVEADHRYLVAGFRQELAACLVRFREWAVRDRATLPAGTATPNAEDGSYLIDASAFESGGNVRLVLMLRDLAAGDYIWSERLQLSVATWVDAQQQIVRRIATALNVNLSAERLSVQMRLPERDYGAYDKWLRAQALISSRERPKMEAALRICENLIEDYPSFAPAYVNLANYYNILHISLPGTTRSRQRTADALRLAREAVRLDPINSRAQLCLAWSYAMAGMANEAHGCATTAFELNDTDPWTRVSSINCQATAGIATDIGRLADELALRGDLLQPLHWAYHAGTLFLAGRHEDVLEAAERAGDAFYTTRAWRAASLACLSRRDEARASLDEFQTSVRQRWTVAEAATDEAIAAWYLQAHPIQRPEVWEALRAALTQAGLAPVPMTHAQAMLR